MPTIDEHPMAVCLVDPRDGARREQAGPDAYPKRAGIEVRVYPSLQMLGGCNEVSFVVVARPSAATRFSIGFAGSSAARMIRRRGSRDPIPPQPGPLIFCESPAKAIRL